MNQRPKSRPRLSQRRIRATRAMKPRAAAKTYAIVSLRIARHSPGSPPEQMRNAADVEPQSVGSIDLDQRRPTAPSFRESLQATRRRRPDPQELRRALDPALRASVSRAPTSRAAFGSGFGDSMDDRPMRALDGEDDRIVRRTVGGLRPAFDRQMRQPDGTTRFTRDAPAAGSHTPRPEQIQRPMPAMRRPRVERVEQRRALPICSALGSAEVRRSAGRTSQQPTPDRSDATARRLVAVKSSTLGSPRSRRSRPRGSAPYAPPPSPTAHHARRVPRHG